METAKLSFDIFCKDITSVIGNNSWKFHDDTMTGNCEKGVTDRQTDGQTDRLADGRTEVFLELLGRSYKYVLSWPFCVGINLFKYIWQPPALHHSHS